MTQAIELNSVRRGYDPREFTLVAGGGAGAAVRLRHRAGARDRARARAAAPRASSRPPACSRPTSSTSSSRTERHALKSLDRRSSQRASTELAGQAVAQLDADGVPEDRRLVRRLADCRYAGPGLRGARRGARRRRRRRLGRGADGALPRRARARVRPSLRRADRDHQHPRRRHRPRRRAAARAARGRRRRSVAARRRSSARWSSTSTAPAERCRTPFYERELLRAGDRIAGPAIVEQYDSTTVIPPGLAAAIDRHGNIVIDCTTRRERRGAAAPALSTPILMRVIGGALHVDRQGDGAASSTACPTRRSSASPRTSAPASSTATATSSPSPTRRRCSWARCRRSSRASSACSATTSTKAT